MAFTSRLHLLFGDITAMEADAIVNSTDETLSQGSALHRSIHQTAGPGLAKACENLLPCLPGQVRVTPGYSLKASHVIHTVAPLWLGGQSSELGILADCYTNALHECVSRRLKTILFPSIGSGTEPQIPLHHAAPAAIYAILNHLEKHEYPLRVTLVCFDSLTYKAYQAALLAAPHDGPLLVKVPQQEGVPVANQEGMQTEGAYVR